MRDWFGRMPEDHIESTTRRREVEELAKRHDLRYSRDVSETILDPRFYLFSVGTGHIVGVGNDMVEGRWDGMDVAAFDFRGVMIGMSDLAIASVGPAGYRYATTTVKADFDSATEYVYIEHKNIWVHIADEVEHMTHL